MLKNTLSGKSTGSIQEDLMTENDFFTKLAGAVIDGEPEDAEELAKGALAQGLDPLECINNGLTVGMERVGELFASGEYFLPDLIIGGDAMKAALAILEPALLDSQQRETLGRVVLGTVEGDLHEIGKTLVGTMLTANGFEVTDIGIDQPASEFVAAVEETKAVLVGASALLTTTMLQQKKVVEELKAAGFGDDVKVIIGGAPVTQSWAEEIGADGYAEDAISAVGVAKKLVGVE
jgi:corrinoid protein of di/trimethylamine methyltransferase